MSSSSPLLASSAHPLPLIELCRHEIHKQMIGRSHLHKNIDTFPIPNSLKRYLMFKGWLGLLGLLRLFKEFCRDISWCLIENYALIITLSSALSDKKYAAVSSILIVRSGFGLCERCLALRYSVYLSVYRAQQMFMVCTSLYISPCFVYSDAVCSIEQCSLNWPAVWRTVNNNPTGCFIQKHLIFGGIVWKYLQQHARLTLFWLLERFTSKYTVLYDLLIPVHGKWVISCSMQCTGSPVCVSLLCAVWLGGI